MFGNEERRAQAAIPRLRALLTRVSARVGQSVPLDIVANGMGARLIVGMLADTSAALRIQQVVLVAPDAHEAALREQSAAMARHAARITVYVSDRDAELIASRSLQPYRRAGDVSQGLMQATGIDVIDASAFADSLGSVSTAIDVSPVARELMGVLTGVSLTKRPTVARVDAGGVAHWQLRPAAGR